MKNDDTTRVVLCTKIIFLQQSNYVNRPAVVSVAFPTVGIEIARKVAKNV